MKKRRVDTDVIILLVSTLITMATWVGFEVYRAYTKPAPIDGVQKHLGNFNPNLKSDVLDKIEKRSQ